MQCGGRGQNERRHQGQLEQGRKQYKRDIQKSKGIHRDRRDLFLARYYRMGSMKTVLHRIDERLRTRMRVVIWKQWKTNEERYRCLRKLGAPEWMARKSAAFGDHYQAVAKTTGLHLISKEILARRGLLSCVDYYLG